MLLEAKGPGDREEFRPIPGPPAFRPGEEGGGGIRRDPQKPGGPDWGGPGWRPTPNPPIDPKPQPERSPEEHASDE
jgi:hypothetical protein